MAETFLTSGSEAASDGSPGAAINDDTSGQTAEPIVGQTLASEEADSSSFVDESSVMKFRLSIDMKLFDHTGKRRYLHNAIRDLDNFIPDMPYDPADSMEGQLAFLNVEVPLSDDDCLKVISEIEASDPSRPPHNPVIVKLVHDILRDPSDDDAETMLGEKLGFASLGAFLNLCHSLINPVDRRDLAKQTVTDLVLLTQLTLTNIMSSKAQRDSSRMVIARSRQSYARPLKAMRKLRTAIEENLAASFKKLDRVQGQLREESIEESASPAEQAEAQRSRHQLAIEWKEGLAALEIHFTGQLESLDRAIVVYEDMLNFLEDAEETITMAT